MSERRTDWCGYNDNSQVVLAVAGSSPSGITWVKRENISDLRQDETLGCSLRVIPSYCTSGLC